MVAIRPSNAWHAGPIIARHLASEILAAARSDPQGFIARLEILTLWPFSQGELVGVEVKASGNAKAEDFRELQALAEATTGRFVRGILLYGGSEPGSLAKHMLALPIHTLRDS